MSSVFTAILQAYYENYKVSCVLIARCDWYSYRVYIRLCKHGCLLCHSIFPILILEHK